MSYQHTIAFDVQPVGTPFRKSSSYSGSMITGLDETIPAAGATTFTNFDVDVSACVALFMLCDRAITITINDDGTPDATITLVANVPLVWTNDGYFSNPLGNVDVTSIKATLASGADASLRIEVVQDAIP